MINTVLKNLKGMLKMKYVIIETNGEVPEYGIMLVDQGIPLISIPQISDNKNDICRLTELLNELQVEPCHFENVVEDYLTDFQI